MATAILREATTLVNRYKVLENLRRKSDEPKKYHLLKWNCEHVSTLCKTGVALSEQTQELVNTLEMAEKAPEKAWEMTLKIANSRITRTLAFGTFRAVLWYGLRSLIRGSTGG